MPRVQRRFLRFGSIAAVAAFAFVTASPAFAAEPPQRGAAAGALVVGQNGQLLVVREQDARATSLALNQLMRRYPPALGQVLRLDPSLLTSQAYLAPYPELAQFLAQHPEIAH